jgi:ferritin-like metal-binding protein YciE
MNDLCVHLLQDIYYAESQITKALPTMIEKAGDLQLKQTLVACLTATQNQVKRLEQVFHSLNQPVKGVTCAAINGIIDEAKEVMGDVADQTVLDAALLCSVQVIEHYKITRYGTLVELCRQLGHHNCINLLEQTLNEERSADKKLTTIAESRVNRAAA